MIDPLVAARQRLDAARRNVARAYGIRAARPDDPLAVEWFRAARDAVLDALAVCEEFRS